jgi:Zn-finger nucleic acid-binding protein
MVEGETNPLSCPNCRQSMQVLQLERHDGGKLRIDLCFPCYAIWFDRWESVQLAPGAVIELFKQIHTHRAEVRQPLGAQLGCPRCIKSLLITRDVSKTGPFSYYRCPLDHGRFTPFFEFLREKQFVRTLNPAELMRVRAQVKQLMCSGCGAPIDLQTESKCSFCAAPIAVLDADAVENGMRIWVAAQRKSHPQTVAEAMTTLDSRSLQTTTKSQELSPIGLLLSHMEPGNDLLEVSIGLLGDIFKSFGRRDP